MDVFQSQAGFIVAETRNEGETEILGLIMVDANWVSPLI
jgi:hypothetical protein